MKLVLFLLILIPALVTAGEDVSKPIPSLLEEFNQIKSQPWLSFSVSRRFWMGDFYDYGPMIVLQKSPEGPIIVSWDKGPTKDGLPVVTKIVSEVDGTKLRSAFLEVFHKALQEVAEVDKLTEKEIEEFSNKTGHTPSYGAIVIRNTGTDLKTNAIAKKYSAKGTAIVELMKIVEELVPQTQANNKGAAQPVTKPADKPAAKDQPPTPTSTDAPR